jgi:hypothetical protein
MTGDARWLRSSRSGSGNENCVELACRPGRVRDSKNPAGPTLNVDLAGFLSAVKAGLVGHDGLEFGGVDGLLQQQ